jgi:uncharacterized protein (TIGR02453 family)
MSKGIPSSSINFLKELKRNNNRDWFNQRKERYLKERESIIAFADHLLASMRKIDHIETESGKASLHRIYRDSRFSSDKTPYKTNWSGGFRRATKLLRGGYYFHIEPGNSFVAGGFFNPNPDDLKRIREDIDLNYEDWNKIFNNKNFIKAFGKLEGEGVKIAPKGYSKDHPGIDLLRHKQFILRHSIDDKDLLSASASDKFAKAFKEMRPFFDYMSDVLTTDSNGVSLF